MSACVLRACVSSFPHHVKLLCSRFDRRVSGLRPEGHDHGRPHGEASGRRVPPGYLSMPVAGNEGGVRWSVKRRRFVTCFLPKSA